ncbi:MAG: hypothetical protein K5772_04170 [Clostridia bacterium]|nr:hypothetical protein [Clostridia bacterium]
MPKKLSLNAQITAHYANLYRYPVTEDGTWDLDTLYNTLADRVENGEEVTNLEKGIKSSLDTFIAYSKLAAQDINNGIAKSPNLQKASDEMGRIVKGFERMKSSNPDLYNRYEKVYGTFAEESKTLSAAAWIEEIQAGMKAGNISVHQAVTRILAVRQLADAQKGNRSNIDKTLITKAQLDDRYMHLRNYGAFYSSVAKNEKKLGEAALSGHGGKMESMFAKIVQDNRESAQWDDTYFGRYKLSQGEYEAKWIMHDAMQRQKLPSASRWIERYMKQMKDGSEEYSSQQQERISGILAARILAKAQRGERYNIDHAHLDETELLTMQNKLMDSRAFSDYIRYKKKQAEDAALKEHENDEDIIALKNELASRYHLPDPQFDHDFRKKALHYIGVDYGVKDFIKGHGGTLEEDFENYLKTRDDLEDLDPAIFGRYQKKKQKSLADEFEIVDAEEIRNQQEAENRQPAEYEGYNDYFQKNRTNQDGTVSKIYHAAKMAAADDLRRNKPDNVFDRKVLQNKAQEYLKDTAFQLLMRDEKLVEKVCGGDVEALANAANDLKQSCPEEFDDFDDSFYKLEGTYEVRKKNDEAERRPLSDEVKRQVKRMNDVFHNTGSAFDPENPNKYDTKKDPENYENRIAALLGKTSNKDIQAMKQAYVNEGGAKYSSMVEACGAFRHDCLTKAEPDKDLYFKSIHSILQYQDEQLGGGPADRQRLKDSMSMLADITAGTGNEKYLDQQIKKANEELGLKAGDPGYFQKNDFLPEAEPENEVEEDVPVNAGGYKDLYDKIRNYRFFDDNEADNSIEEKKEEGPVL